jgi:hypothetical protein
MGNSCKLEILQSKRGRYTASEITGVVLPPSKSPSLLKKTCWRLASPFIQTKGFRIVLTSTFCHYSPTKTKGVITP